jgi:hypothetical protein
VRELPGQPLRVTAVVGVLQRDHRGVDPREQHVLEPVGSDVGARAPEDQPRVVAQRGEHLEPALVRRGVVGDVDLDISMILTQQRRDRLGEVLLRAIMRDKDANARHAGAR